jgi:hypothetical protein
MLRFLADRRLYLLIRLAMGGMMLAAGLAKLVQLDIFVMILEVYSGDADLGLSTGQLRSVGLGLGCLEIVTGLGVACGLRGFVHLMGLQMLLFIAVLVYAIASGLDVPCGCFILDDPDKPFHKGLRPALYRDLFFLLPIGYLLWYRKAGAGTVKGTT